MKVLSLLVAALSVTLAHSDANVVELQSRVANSLQVMAEVFSRSDQMHQESMQAISSHMSVPNAVEVLEKSSRSTPALIQAANMALGKQTSLRKQPKGYAGIDGARKLLNDMIYESMSKYDAEIAKCTEYYSKQCAAMEACRGQIAASNYVAANSRALILDSQATINLCEVEIPQRELELKKHNEQCEHELKRLNDRLKIVLGDIAVMTIILEMTDCDAKLLQVKNFAVLQCVDQCTKKHFIKFNHKGLQEKVSHLQSSVSHELMRNTFEDLFAGVKSLEVVEFKQDPVSNKTQFNNPPVPRTEVPMNPCTDPNMGAPSAADKNAAKCSLNGSPQCYKLQERFLLIQAGIEDERDELMQEISMLEEHCEEHKQGLETQIQNDKDMLANAQTKLAAATEKEATAGEAARQTNAENTQLNNDLVDQMKKCSGNYINFETELCALKKIRGELYKLQGGGHSAFFQDCEVSKWDPEECTKKCAGGEQMLTRSVLTHPDGGADCLSLEAERSCNNVPCPVDCDLSSWSEWSKCSAQCGGGVQQRLREVKQAMKYGGKPCLPTSEGKSCNMQACEKDCELSRWTKWSRCSKDCDGGTKKRVKFVHKQPEGEGTCPDAWSGKRLQYENCNMHRCKVANAVLPCNKTMDVVLMLDGSGSLGQAGWDAEMKAAQYFVDAFKDSGKGNMAVILFSGPRTWSGVFKCTGPNKDTVDPEECGIKTVTHFTTDMQEVSTLIAAKAELQMGRKDATSVIVVFTDGRPLSYRKTTIASRLIRKGARLLWVPVTQYAPLKWVKKWATRRWQENVVKVDTFEDLETPDPITHIMADICPEQSPELQMGRPLE